MSSNIIYNKTILHFCTGPVLIRVQLNTKYAFDTLSYDAIKKEFSEQDEYQGPKKAPYKMPFLHILYANKVLI